MGYISILLLSFFISLGFSIFIIPRILLISFKKHLFDMPDERKVHKGIIPRLGGVSFFPAVIFTLSLMIGLNRIYGEELFPSIIGVSDTSVLSFGLSSLLLLYLTGITDDLIGVRYRQKFIVQIFCAILLVSSGLWINNLYGIFGIYELPPVVGLPFTVFTILFIYQREWLYAALAIVTLGTIIPFFYYNVFGNPNRGRKIFMGDTGSLTIGFILSILAIRFSMYDNAVLHRVPDAIVVAFSLLITPVFDVVRVILHRARFGKTFSVLIKIIFIINF